MCSLTTFPVLTFDFYCGYGPQLVTLFISAIKIQSYNREDVVTSRVGLRILHQVSSGGTGGVGERIGCACRGNSPG